MSVEESVQRFDEWLNAETDSMSDEDYLELLSEISDRTQNAFNAKQEELEDKE